MSLSDELFEFTDVEPDAVHLVGVSANGFPAPLLAKAAEALDVAQNDALIKEFVDGLCAVPHCEVCHERYLAVKEINGGIQKAKIKSRERNSLDDGDFAFPKERKEPLTDASHVRNAMARFNQVEGVSDEERAAAHRKIVARAKELGIDVDEFAEKDTQDIGASEVQTHSDPDAPEPSGPAPEADPEGHARSVSFPHNGESDGGGDTAPDKDLHESEAESQTRSDPATKAAELLALIDEREKTEGGPTAKEFMDLLSEMQHLPEDLQKEIDEMPTTELFKALDERLSARREDADAEAAAKAAAEAAYNEAVAKAAKKEGKKLAREAAAKAAAEGGSAEGDGDGDADDASKAAVDPSEMSHEDLVKAYQDLAGTVEKIAAEDGKRIPLNPAGVTAFMRGDGTQEHQDSVLKMFEDRIEAARAAQASATSPMAKEKANQELKSAMNQRFLAKMIANESGRANGTLPQGSRFGQSFTPLFREGSTHSIGEDPDIRYTHDR